MSVGERPPPPSGDKWKPYAERLSDYLVRIRSRLAFLSPNESAFDDGVILWSPTGYPVVSKNGEYRQIVLADGYGFFYNNSSIALTANTATPITYTADANNESLSISGSEITFEESGKYLISFSAEISSSSSSTVNFAFWPRLNGSNVANSTMRNALHQNNSTLVVSRTALFSLSSGDVLQAMTASDSSSGSLSATTSAIAGEPASPSSTISIMRISQ